MTLNLSRWNSKTELNT